MSKRAEEKRKNCLGCNKSLKKVDWYYKDNGYFCNKSCFKSYLKKKKPESV
ncbi:MAG: hypothetical protein ABIH08_03275 [Candidatus Omnitrophota bacterium]